MVNCSLYIIRANRTPKTGLKEKTRVDLLAPRYFVDKAYVKILNPYVKNPNSINIGMEIVNVLFAIANIR